MISKIVMINESSFDSVINGNGVYPGLLHHSTDRLKKILTEMFKEDHELANEYLGCGR